MSTDADRDTALRPTLDQLGTVTSLSGYQFSRVTGATQAMVWKGVPRDSRQSAVALRLTPKPAALVARIAAAVDELRTVECPQTLTVQEVTVSGRVWTAHLCTWIGVEPTRTPDAFALGGDLARLHRELADCRHDFSDRRLSFERHPAPPPDQELPSWYVARHLWRDRVYAWVAAEASRLPAQPIHGDLHWANVVATAAGGFGFIDFDKLMFAPPVFDVAKLLATGYFQVGRSRVRFSHRDAKRLVEGYHAVRPMSDAEVVAVEALAVVLNEETARLGSLYDVESYRRQSSAVAQWWINRFRRSRRDPLSLREQIHPPASPKSGAGQPALWTDDEL